MHQAPLPITHRVEYTLHFPWVTLQPECQRVRVQGTCKAAWRLKRLIIECVMTALWWERPLLWLGRVPVVRFLLRPLIGWTYRRCEDRRRAASRAAKVSQVTVMHYTPDGFHIRDEALLLEALPTEVFSQLAIGTEWQAPTCNPGDGIAITLEGKAGTFDVTVLLER